MPKHHQSRTGIIEENTRFRAALEAMLDSVVMTTAIRDEQGRVVDFLVDYVNPVAEIGQREAGEIVGRRFLDVWPGARNSPIWDRYLHLMDTGEPVVLDDFPYTEVIGGRPVTAVFDIRATRLGDGFLQNFRDVTSRHRTRQQLAASEKRFRSAVDAVLYPFFLLNPIRGDDGKIIEFEYGYANRAALELYQMPEDEVVGHGQVELFPSVKELGIFDRYVQAVETGVPAKIDVPYFDEAGVEGSFELVATPGEDNLIVAAVDVSEIKRAQQALRTLNAELETRVSERTAELVRAEADRRVLEADLMQAERLQTTGQLASGIAHDFKNLLGIIIAYTERAHDISATPEARRVITEIEEAARRADRLAGDLVSFGGRSRAQPEAVDLNALVAKVLDLMGVSMRGARIRFEPWPDGLPRVLIDPLRLEQVLLNLALNASDAMPGGGTLTIQVRPLRIDQDGAGKPDDLEDHGSYVELVVSDTGIGMSAEVKSRIFDRFFTTKPQGTGAGLGLTTVQGIIAEAGGMITVESCEGEGTTFHICLPTVAT